MVHKITLNREEYNAFLPRMYVGYGKTKSFAWCNSPRNRYSMRSCQRCGAERFA
jgi:hypothetical protein